jgi:hypothetical protein
MVPGRIADQLHSVDPQGLITQEERCAHPLKRSPAPKVEIASMGKMQFHYDNFAILACKSLMFPIDGIFS